MAGKALEERMRAFALKNAFEHGGKAHHGAVLGRLLGDDPALKNKMAELGKTISIVLKEVNALKPEEQLAELKKHHPELLERKKEGKKELPELENAVTGNVTMRMAPNPSGPLHIGHCRMIILNDEYAKKYNGVLILRFDDTDPKNENKKPMKEAYAWAEEDLKWLGVNYYRVERASARLEKYYEFFSLLLRKGVSYVCSCPQEEWSQKVRVRKEYCPCRSLSVEENLERWRKMLEWEYKEGQAVGRMKTLEGEKDPAVVDWPTFRIVDEPEHPFSSAHVWPMLDFASAFDDYDMKVTHIIRGKDLAASERKQRVIYDYMEWKYPITEVYGKFGTTEDLVISKSKIAQGIREGKYSGYDDPKLLALLKSFKKRGIQPEAIRNYILSLGLTQHETNVDLDILYNENKKLVDATANRYFAVVSPEKVRIEQLGNVKASAPLHPGDEGRGKRTLEVENGEVYAEKEDLENASNGVEFRLLHLCNAVMANGKLREVKASEMPQSKIHWVPAKGSLELELHTTSGVRNGFVERGVLNEKTGNVVQFERVGFARIESVSGEKVVAYYSHK
ncbi:MAG TPA: glutamate--tRNA ligase [archaeon]|nr:glutamate--tRNA ligase [archaeon]